MMVLLRNCAHGSEVATYLREEGDTGPFFVKVALTPEGREALRSELEGWTWYQSVRMPARPPVCRGLRIDRHVVRIGIERIAGIAGRAADGLQRNAALIGRTIDQYCRLWSVRGDEAPFHGDLSCDNLIDGADGVVVIDWEHFRPAGAPWGYDAVYLLCESLYFEARRRTLGSADAAFVAGQLRRLRAGGPLHEEFLQAPVQAVSSFIRRHPGLWRGELERNPMKLPVLSLSDAEMRAMDSAIRSAPAGPS